MSKLLGLDKEAPLSVHATILILGVLIFLGVLLATFYLPSSTTKNDE